MKYKEIIGKQFGDWVVIKTTSTTDKVICKCSICGSEKTVDKYSLVYGRTTKCRACSTSESHSTEWTGNPIRHIFSGMWCRCCNPKDKHYQDYGGRGITICEEWLNDRTVFYRWAMDNGYHKGMSIERIDNNKGYSPDNCKFIPKTIQNRNRRSTLWIEYNGEKMCLTEACKKADICYGSVQMYRNRNHCSVQKSFNHFLLL